VQARASGLAVPGGLIHDWIGIVFVPAATIDAVLATLQNYNSADKTYAPEVVRSKILNHDDDHFRVFLRLRKHSLITVVLDVIYDVQYVRLDPLRAESRSQSIRLTDVEKPGTPDKMVSRS